MLANIILHLSVQMCDSTAGPLDKYLRQHSELVQRKDILLYVATQICSAMKWLEAKGIAHEDLVSSFIACLTCMDG